MNKGQDRPVQPRAEVLRAKMLKMKMLASQQFTETWDKFRFFFFNMSLCIKGLNPGKEWSSRHAMCVFPGAESFQGRLEATGRASSKVKGLGWEGMKPPPR